MGIALSCKHFNNGLNRPAILSDIIKRYFRLGIPLLAVCSLSLLLYSSGCYTQQILGQLTGSQWLAGYRMTEDGQFTTFLHTMIFRLFKQAESYNPPCWSIFQELIGSYIVFLVLLIFRDARWRLGSYSMGLILLRHQYCQLFIIGMMMAEYIPLSTAAIAGVDDREGGRSRQWLSWGCMAIGLWLGSFPYYMTLPPESPWMFLGVVTPWLNQFIKDGPLTIAGTLLLVGILTNASAQSLLSHRFFQYLGKISLSMYLLHFPLLCSFTSALFILLDRQLAWDYHLSFLMAAIASVPPLWLTSHYFYIWVDKPSMAFANRFGQTVMQWRLPKSSPDRAP